MLADILIQKLLLEVKMGLLVYLTCIVKSVLA